MGSLTKGYIGEQDLHKWAGTTADKTFTRQTSTGGTLTLNSVGYEVDALISYGGGTSYTQATIEAALTAIGTVNKTTLLLRPGTWVISSNADWSAYTNVTFKIVPGVLISHAAFTVNIPNLDASIYQVFSGTGTITLSGNVKEVYPEWFATNTTPGTTDMTAAFALAISTNVNSIKLQSTTYKVDTISILAGYHGRSIIGTSKKHTVIKGTADTTQLLNIGNGGYATDLKFENFTLDITDVPDLATNSAIYMKTSYNNSFNDISVIGNGTLKLSLDLRAGTYTTVFTSVDFSGLTGKISIVGNGVGDRVTTTTFIGCSMAQVTMDWTLSTTFLQPVFQGDFDRFIISNSYNLSVIGGDIETDTPATYYVYKIGAGTIHIASFGNEISNHLYRDGDAFGSYFLDFGSEDLSIPVVMTQDGTTAGLNQNAVETMFTALNGAVYLVTIPMESGGNGAWRGTFIVSYTTAVGAIITTINASDVDCVASGAAIQAKNTSATPAISLVWSFVRLK